jgi:hypothetical protein
MIILITCLVIYDQTLIATDSALSYELFMTPLSRIWWNMECIMFSKSWCAIIIRHLWITWSFLQCFSYGRHVASITVVVNDMPGWSHHGTSEYNTIIWKRLPFEVYVLFLDSCKLLPCVMVLDSRLSCYNVCVSHMVSISVHIILESHYIIALFEEKHKLAFSIDYCFMIFVCVRVLCKISVLLMEW